MNFNFVILTFNEARHITRCIESVLPVADSILVVDSYSTDNTQELSRKFDCVTVVENEFINQSQQFNWAIDNFLGEGWIFRIDADEVLSLELQAELKQFQPAHFCGISVNRHLLFRHDVVRYGGLYPHNIIRGFRLGFGKCEALEMDEHIVVNGAVAALKSKLIDASELSVDEWVLKHLKYSIREAYSYFENQQMVAYIRESGTDVVEHWSIRRFLKKNLFYRLPPGSRALLYFLYRFFIRLGILDHGGAFYYHFFQGLWYRSLVDFRIFEIQRYCSKHGVSFKVAFYDLYHFSRK